MGKLHRWYAETLCGEGPQPELGLEWIYHTMVCVCACKNNAILSVLVSSVVLAQIHYLYA